MGAGVAGAGAGAAAGGDPPGAGEGPCLPHAARMATVIEANRSDFFILGFPLKGDQIGGCPRLGAPSGKSAQATPSARFIACEGDGAGLGDRANAYSPSGATGKLCAPAS